MSPVPARARQAVSVCHLAALGAFAASSGTPGPVTRAWRCCLFSGQPPRTAAVALAWTFLPSVCHRLQFPQNALPETPFHPSPARKRRRRVASVASVPQAGPFVTRSPLLVCDFPHCWPRRFPPPSRHCDEPLPQTCCTTGISRAHVPQKAPSPAPLDPRVLALAHPVHAAENCPPPSSSVPLGGPVRVPPGRAPVAGDTAHARAWCAGVTEPWEDDAMFSGPFASRRGMHSVSSTWVRP